MHKTPIFFLLALLSVFLVNPVIADENVIYDSGKLSISAWHVQLSKHIIASDNPDKAYLNIVKNTPGSDIRAGFLILNHKLIPLTRWLTGADTTLKKQIRLKRTNRLRVFLIGTPGASITISVHGQAKDQPLPSVAFGATPLQITRGDATTLTWTSTNADACVIAPDIGSVETNASVAVSPIATTTYAITASGAGGASTASVTVVVMQPVPTVEIFASPEAINPGESATLTWRTTHADACVIAPDIGAVDLNGSMSVAPMATESYTITATGPGGISTRTVTVTLAPRLGIQIVSPVEGESINRPDTMVRGTFTNSTGSETGIRVNGKVAATWKGQFVANHVPLDEGANTIGVTATDVNGDTQTATVSVTAVIPEHHIEMSANLESGSSPLDASLHIGGSFSIDDSSLSYTGSGAVDYLETGVDAYRVSLTDEGITYFTAEVVHASVVYTDTIGMVVVDAAEIDALLQQKWVDMKTKLGSGDIAGALNHFSEATQPMFAYNFNLLSAHMNEIIAGMQRITLVKVVEDRAEYHLQGEQGGQAFSFYLLFQKTADGTWRILFF